jgi:hypothetical protein
MPSAWAGSNQPAANCTAAGFLPLLVVPRCCLILPLLAFAVILSAAKDPEELTQPIQVAPFFP